MQVVEGPITLEVYIPQRMCLSDIAPGSAIVGQGQKDGYVQIYYEGNVYGASNIKTFRDKVIQAAGRLIQKYPTMATRLVPLTSLVEASKWKSGPGPSNEKPFWEDSEFHAHFHMIDEMEEWQQKAAE